VQRQVQRSALWQLQVAVAMMRKRVEVEVVAVVVFVVVSYRLLLFWIVVCGAG